MGVVQKVSTQHSANTVLTKIREKYPRKLRFIWAQALRKLRRKCAQKLDGASCAQDRRKQQRKPSDQKANLSPTPLISNLLVYLKNKAEVRSWVLNRGFELKFCISVFIWVNSQSRIWALSDKRVSNKWTNNWFLRGRASLAQASRKRQRTFFFWREFRTTPIYLYMYLRAQQLKIQINNKKHKLKIVWK